MMMSGMVGSASRRGTEAVHHLSRSRKGTTQHLDVHDLTVSELLTARTRRGEAGGAGAKPATGVQQGGGAKGCFRLLRHQLQRLPPRLPRAHATDWSTDISSSYC